MDDSIKFTKASIDRAIKGGQDEAQVLISEAASRYLEHGKAGVTRTEEAAFSAYLAGKTGLITITKTGGVEKESGKVFGARFGIKDDNVNTVTSWWISGNARHAGVKVGTPLWTAMTQSATYAEVKAACLADDATVESIQEAVDLWGRNGTERQAAKKAAAAAKAAKAGPATRKDNKAGSVELTLTAGQQCEAAVQMLTDNLGSISTAEAESLHVALGKILAKLTLRSEEAAKKAEAKAAKAAESAGGLKVKVS